MSKLPSGYTELEYIHLDGTQYIDMGFKATENTKIEAKFHNEQSANSAVFGADKAWTQDAFGIWINSTIAVPVVGTVSGTINVSYSSAYDTFTLDKDTLKLNGGTIWTASGVSAFQTPTNVCLGAVNRNGTVSEKFVGRMYYCKAWESDTLIRNFVPCKNASGVIGLYDMVGRQFYANAGTGAFTAGPEIIPDPPAAPIGLQTVLAVALRWAASEGAETYNVYRDGAKIGSTGATQFVDLTAGENETYNYTVTAENSGGESAGVSVTVYTKSGYFQYKPLIESANFP